MRIVRLLKVIPFVALLFLAGCACMAQENDGTRSGLCQLFVTIGDFFLGSNSSIGFTLLGMGLNTILPGSAAILATAAAGYQGMRKSQWQRAMTTTAQVIETGAELGMTVQDLKPHLADAHAMANVDHLVQPMVQKLAPDLVVPEMA